MLPTIEWQSEAVVMVDQRKRHERRAARTSKNAGAQIASILANAREERGARSCIPGDKK